MRIPITVSLSEEIVELIHRAVSAGRFSGASEYVRACIVEERKRSGDSMAEKVKPMRKRGRQRAA